MQIIENTLEVALPKKSAIAIGKFDGIHIGHQKLIEEILSQKENGMQAVIFTFDPPPQVLFSKKLEKQIMTKEEKRIAFEKLGIDVLFEFPLTIETAAMSPADFVKNILVKGLRAGLIVAGTDLSFGDHGKGDFHLLESMKEQYDYEVKIFEKVCVDKEIVSSTLIRKCIEAGNMEKTKTLLGNPFEITGIVEPGKQLGRTISFPTLNLFPKSDKMLPPVGVYCSEIMVENKKYQGITNVGVRPTVSNSGQVSVETFVFDFSEDIYGKSITVCLLHHTRTEMKFDSVEALKTQLEQDKIEGKAFFSALQMKKD